MSEVPTPVVHDVLRRLGFEAHTADGFPVYRHGESGTVIALPRWDRPAVPAAEMQVIRQQVVWRGVATGQAFDEAIAAATAKPLAPRRPRPARAG